MKSDTKWRKERDLGVRGDLLVTSNHTGSFRSDKTPSFLVIQFHRWYLFPAVSQHIHYITHTFIVLWRRFGDERPKITTQGAARYKWKLSDPVEFNFGRWNPRLSKWFHLGTISNSVGRIVRAIKFNCWTTERKKSFCTKYIWQVRRRQLIWGLHL